MTRARATNAAMLLLAAACGYAFAVVRGASVASAEPGVVRCEVVEWSVRHPIPVEVRSPQALVSYDKTMTDKSFFFLARSGRVESVRFAPTPLPSSSVEICLNAWHGPIDTLKACDQSLVTLNNGLRDWSGIDVPEGRSVVARSLSADGKLSWRAPPGN